MCAYVLDCLNVGPIEPRQYESALNVSAKLWFNDFSLQRQNKGLFAGFH
jgi:hypothetical protein